MKIGIDASRYGGEKATGVEFYSRHIIDGILAERGTEDEVILYSREPLPFLEMVTNKVIDAKRMWTLRGLSREMKNDPPDVLFVPSHVLPLKRPARSVITIHDVAFRYLKSSYSPFAYRYLNWSTKYAVKHADCIIVPSEATKKDLIHFFKCKDDKVVVIPHGFTMKGVSARDIDETFRTSDAFKYFGIRKDSKYLLFVGRLESKKNLVRLIKAFTEFSHLHPEYRLILGGSRGVGFDRILKTAKDLRILDKVVMPGYLTEEEKVALYKYAEAFVFPSLYEGFGFPLLESFHFNVPVLTSHVSCLPEVGGDACLYVDPYDVSDIVRGLDQIINDNELRDRLTESGKERLKLYSWKEAAKKTLATFATRRN